MFMEGLLKRAPNHTALERYLKFARDTSRGQLYHHCHAPATKNHINRGVERRSSQLGQRHMRTKLYLDVTEILQGEEMERAPLC